MSNLDIKFQRLTPFKRCVIQNFPFIEADFDALTNYGLLCKIVEYLNQVIASQNEVQGVTENLVTSFNSLYDYVHDFFDNLDVQEEINNKLDEMVEDGTIQSMFEMYAPYITFEQYGAKGDGTTDDTEAMQAALNQGKPISCPSGQTYLITDNLTLKSNVFDLNGSVIKSTTGNNLVAGSDTKFVDIRNGELNGVGVLDTTETKVDYCINNVYMHDTDKYGFQIGTCGKVSITNSKFYEIGKGNSVNINIEACGIRVNGADFVEITGNYFEKCHGTGATVVRGVSKYDISHNTFYKNDYRGIATSSQAGEICSGIISENNIQECGTYASHNTGVGCNGIYSNDYGDITDTVVTNNYIKNVCENGIEGAYGVVSYNTVINTGVDQSNHPTPSASGINMYGKKYIGNTVINPYLAAYYVSGNTHSESTDLSNKIIKDNFAGLSAHTPAVAIYVNGTTYTNIDIRNNLMEGGLQLAPAATYTNCSIGDNTNKLGDKYYNVNYLPTIVSTSGVVKFNKFEESGGTISNVTTASASYTIDTNYVEFTSTGTTGAFSITADCSTDALNTLIVKTDQTDFKVTATGVNDDDTTTTIAYQRTIVSDSNGVAGFTTKTKGFKKIKYTFIIGASGNTMKVYSIKAKEMFDI